MSKYPGWILSLALTGAFAACAGESSLSRDLGPGMEGGQQDQAITGDGAQPDQMTEGSSCGEILTCIAACDSRACGNECIATGSPHAQQLISDLLSCQDRARAGTCKEQCSSTTPQCFACVDRVCGTETHDCLFGNPLPGFGERCDDLARCADLLTCAGQQSTGQGYCTYTCETPNELCLGAPADTYASCITPLEGVGYVCGFICKRSETIYKCPAPQVCSSEEAPPAGSGVYLCEAPPS